VNAASGRRRPFVTANWKMNKTVAEARAFVHELRAIPLPDDVELALAPPFTALEAVHGELRDLPIRLAAQNMNAADRGAFTGEISPPMLKELGVSYVILGHSEVRRYLGETDAAVGKKVRSALAHDITPIVAVGEDERLHAAGRAVEHCSMQLRIAFEGIAAEAVARCVVAYEPIWAIGTGLSEDPVMANERIAELRRSVAGLANVRVLYGGSMNAANAAALMAQLEIDGGLIGGASLEPESFAAIAAAASSAQAAR
jgi:triosephosphate isomerase (TIM)